MKIGLVGTESDHAEDFMRMLNREGRHPGFRVAAIWGSDRERTQTLAAEYGVPHVAERAQDLLGHVDAVVVGDRHGGAHLAHALPYLHAGLPVFVDKPLAVTVSDATRILAAANESGALITSASALRWQADLDELKRRVSELAPLERVVTTGTFHADSPYGGSVFYGVHAVEMALELAGADIGDLEVELATEAAMTITGRVGRTAVEIRLVRPAEDGGSAFHAEIASTLGSAGRQIRLADDYMGPVLDRFITMIRSGTMPLTPAELLAPVRVLEFAETRLRRALG